MKASEETVCLDAEIICRDPINAVITILSPEGELFNSDATSSKIPLNTEFQEVNYWSAVSSLNSRIIVAGTDYDNKSIEFLLVKVVDDD